MRARRWYKASFGDFLQETDLVLGRLHAVSSEQAETAIRQSGYRSLRGPCSLYLDYVAEAQEALLTPATTAAEIAKLIPADHQSSPDDR